MLRILGSKRIEGISFCDQKALWIQKLQLQFFTGILFLSITHMYNYYNFNSSLVIIRLQKAIIKKKGFAANTTDIFQDKTRPDGNRPLKALKTLHHFQAIVCVLLSISPLCRGSPRLHRSEKCIHFFKIIRTAWYLLNVDSGFHSSHQILAVWRRMST